MKRLAFYVVAGLAVLLVVGWLAWSFDPFGRRKAAETRAANAEAQSKVDGVTTKALDTYVTKTIIIRERADAAVQSVQQAPGAATPVDPDRRDILCDQLASVRGAPVCSDDLHSAGPAGAVQGADDAATDPG